MIVKGMLCEMQLRSFDADYDACIQEAYEQWVQREGLDLEREYTDAKDALNSILNGAQQVQLRKIENNDSCNLEYASRYGFLAGLYSGFHQYFVEGHTALDGFHQVLEEHLFTLPGMQRHVGFYGPVI